MNAIEIIKDLRQQNFTVKTNGQRLGLAPAARVTNELIERLRKHKPAIIAELKREERREKVLKMLADNPGIQRSFLTDTESDPDGVILAMAIRDVASFEMLIPREKYDAFALVEIINMGLIQ